jgi:hypothetical protein
MMTHDERNANPIQEMLQLTQERFKLSAWAFHESFRSAENKILIFDSKWCRIKFTWEGWDPLVGNSISIIYGRLHAPSEESFMDWKGEECYCWHRIEYALHFLDGCTISKAIELNRSHRLLNKYYEKEYRHKYHRHQSDWLMNMQIDVWKHYGERFFELFDLHRPDLWKQYSEFLKKFYALKGHKSYIKPPLDKIC